MTGQRGTGLGPAYADAIHIRCPYEPCRAEPGVPCVNEFQGVPLVHAPHWQRIKAAEEVR